MLFSARRPLGWVETSGASLECKLQLACLRKQQPQGCTLNYLTGWQCSMKDDSPTSHVSELDEAWALALAEAEQRARAAGRTDITTYLALRTSNDLLRKTGRDWLQTMFATVAGEANRTGAGIQISREDDHRFKVGTATMVGSRLSLSNGVRMLFVEVGWPRTPSDGFIRGGGLACANIKHLGIKSASE